MTPYRHCSQTPLSVKHTSVWILGAALIFLLSGGAAVAQHARHRHTGHVHEPKLHSRYAAPPDKGMEPPQNYLVGYDLTLYSNKERTEIVSEAFRVDCDCGCNMTVARCLVNDRSCLRVRQMAEAIIERVTGEPYLDVKIDRSLDKGPIVGVDLEQLPKEQADKLLERLKNMYCACSYGLLHCLATDPWCKASPLILVRTYREITGSELLGATPLRVSEVEVKTYDTLPGVDLSRLSDEQRTLVIKWANERPCTCGRGYTLAECRHENPGCERSPASINGIIFSVLTRVEE
ncbi:MAG: hypothetical protein JSV08_03475 [Acidobacteriota bacterium]|nr:MAG: hypothetical protein JSV08_03475 [Acidobacteriota bacterium]